MPDLEDIDGIGPTIARKMRERGIFSSQDLAACDANQLIDDKVTDSRDTANKFISAAQQLMDGLEGEYTTALEDYVARSGSVKKLTTGSKSLDRMLGGGVETRAVTEFYGEFGSGKSQLCHTLAVLTKDGFQVGGLEGSVIYLDTEGTFRPERILEIVKARMPEIQEEEAKKYLSNIFLARAHNTERLLWYVKTAGKMIIEKNVKLMIVDSLTSLHRAEFIGRGQLAERQQKLNQIIHKLVRIAEYFNIAVVFTNQVQSAPDTFFGDPTKATGGNVVAHGSTYRIYLRKSGGDKLATFIDSPYHAYTQCRFTVTSAGVVDAEDKKAKAEKDSSA